VWILHSLQAIRSARNCSGLLTFVFFAGGKQRAKNLTDRERSEGARKAVLHVALGKGRESRAMRLAGTGDSNHSLEEKASRLEWRLYTVDGSGYDFGLDSRLSAANLWKVSTDFLPRLCIVHETLETATVRDFRASRVA